MTKLPEGRKPLPNEWFIDRANKMENANMQRYAVMIDVDGDWMYVPDTWSFPNHPDPKIFTSFDDAVDEKEKWNTGIVVEYPTKHIRSMTREERKRAIERSQINGK